MPEDVLLLWSSTSLHLFSKHLYPFVTANEMIPSYPYTCQSLSWGVSPLEEPHCLIWQSTVKSSSSELQLLARADGSKTTDCRYVEVSNDRLFKPLFDVFCPPVGAKRVMWDVREHNDSLTCPFEDPSMPRTSPSEIHRRLWPFFFLSCFECTSQTTPQVFVSMCFSALWLQQLLFRMKAVSTCSAAWSASIAQPLYVSEPWGWPPALTNSPARFSFQDGFSRRTSATVTCGLFSKILLLLKTCCRYRLAEMSSGLLSS